MHTFLDDASRRPCVRFLKGKTEAVQAVKDHLTNLKTQGKNPRAIRFDRGTEFVNDDLLTWLREQGIEVQMTASYSPAQNGAAERLNRTLVDLARAMMIAREIPSYLWEYAIAYAIYVRERASTRTLKGKTPYEAWTGVKPNVAHLREFGTPVYVLLQGPKEQAKMLPRSKPYVFLGFHDGSKSVKYYDADTKRVLTSRNFQFLTNLPFRDSPPEPIYVPPLPALPLEGEYGENELQTGSQLTNPNPKKRHYEELQQMNGETNEPPQRKLRQMDVKGAYLNGKIRTTCRGTRTVASLRGSVEGVHGISHGSRNKIYKGQIR
jgi:hypothetical protein